LEITAILSNSPPLFSSNPLTKPDALAGQNYSGSIATNATDPNGDPITFAKLNGPAWLGIAANGALSGLPLSGDVGTNSFVVRATDSGGLTNIATLNIKVIAALPLNASIRLANTNVILNWSGGISPYQVQMTTQLTPGTWEQVGGPVNTNQLILPRTNAATFYRVLGR
jgi:hypothetical protein